MRTTTLLTVFCTALLISCEPVSEPEVNVPDPSFAVNPVAQTASGSGNTTRPDWAPWPGGWRVFSFHAWLYANDVVEGHFHYKDHDVDYQGYDVIEGHGIVTCMSIVGNTAYLGGEITNHSIPESVGKPVRFRVMDNGEGENTDPDLISYIAAWGNPENWCENRPPDLWWATWVEVNSGNIQLKP